VTERPWKQGLFVARSADEASVLQAFLQAVRRVRSDARNVLGVIASANLRARLESRTRNLL